MVELDLNASDAGELAASTKPRCVGAVGGRPASL